MTEVAQGPVETDEFEGFIDTYSFGGTETFTLPDGKQTITFKVMNEGEKAKFQRLTNRDIRIDRKTDQALFKPDMALDRHALIKTAVVGWNLYTRDAASGRWTSLAFNDTMLSNWLQVAPPRIVEDLETAIRKKNPWLMAQDMSADEIEAQIAELNELLAEVRLRDKGK